MEECYVHSGLAVSRLHVPEKTAQKAMIASPPATASAYDWTCPSGPLAASRRSTVVPLPTPFTTPSITCWSQRSPSRTADAAIDEHVHSASPVVLVRSSIPIEQGHVDRANRSAVSAAAETTAPSTSGRRPDPGQRQHRPDPGQAEVRPISSPWNPAPPGSGRTRCRSWGAPHSPTSTDRTTSRIINGSVIVSGASRMCSNMRGQLATRTRRRTSGRSSGTCRTPSGRP